MFLKFEFSNTLSYNYIILSSSKSSGSKLLLMVLSYIPCCFRSSSIRFKKVSIFFPKSLSFFNVSIDDVVSISAAVCIPNFSYKI